MARGLLAGVVFGVLVAVLILAVAALQIESRKPMIVMIAPEVLSILGAEPPVWDRQGGVSGQSDWDSTSAADWDWAIAGVAARLSHVPEATILPVFAPLPQANVLRPVMPLPVVADAPAVSADLRSSQPLDVSSLSLFSDGPPAGIGDRSAMMLGDEVLAQGAPDVPGKPSRARVAVPVEDGNDSLPLAIIQTPSDGFVSLTGRPELAEPVSPTAGQTLGVLDTQPARPVVPEIPPQRTIAAPQIATEGIPVLPQVDYVDTAASPGASIAQPDPVDRLDPATLAAPLVTQKPAEIAAPPSVSGLAASQLPDANLARDTVADAFKGQPIMAIVLDRQGDAPAGLPVWSRSIIVPAVALSGDAATVPENAEVLPKIRDRADRGALSALAWDIGRHPGRIGPLYSSGALANEQAVTDLLGLLRAAEIGLVLDGGGLPLLDRAETAGIAVASGYPATSAGPDQPVVERLSRAAIHARRDGAVIVIVQDTEANRTAIGAWLGTGPGVGVVSAAQALDRLRAAR